MIRLSEKESLKSFKRLKNVGYIITMMEEGSIEHQGLQQILDKEEGNGNVSAKTTTIWDNISAALDECLRSISILEEIQRKVNDLRERINCT